MPERAVDVRGEGLIYVRRDGEDQSWLARGRLPLHKTVAEWLDPVFVDIPREELARVTLWGGTDNPVIIERASKEESDFAIINMPAGRATRGAPVVNGVATALAGKSFDDVAPADTLDLPGEYTDGFLRYVRRCAPDHEHGRAGRCAVGEVLGGSRSGACRRRRR